ncbi:MAG: hypothetical protein ACO3JL_09655 [Myxococcota bacterium]
MWSKTAALSTRLADVFLAQLTGDGQNSYDDLPGQDELRESREDDPDGIRWQALLLAQHETLPRRVALALEQDRAPVVLDDGTKLPRDDAERLLARKEETRAFLPLRRSLDRSDEGFRRRWQQEREHFDAHVDAVLDGATSSLPQPERAKESLTVLVRDLADACQEAKDILARAGHVDLETPASFARGIDLPDIAGFSEATSRGLGRALREAARPFGQRDLRAVKVPRLMGGLVVTAATGPIRIGHCFTSGAGRWLADVEAAGIGVGCTLFASGRLTPALEDQAHVLGNALALLVDRPFLRRALLGEDSGSSEGRARITAATRLLRTRIEARVALALLEDPEREAVREHLASFLGFDPPASLLDGLSLPPWPGRRQMRVQAAALGARAMQRALGARLALALRDRFDEAAGIVAAPYEHLAGAKEALADGHLDIFGLFDVAYTEEAPGKALVAWSGELLS